VTVEQILRHEVDAQLAARACSVLCWTASPARRTIYGASARLIRSDYVARTRNGCGTSSKHRQGPESRYRANLRRSTAETGPAPGTAASRTAMAAQAARANRAASPLGRSKYPLARGACDRSVPPQRKRIHSNPRQRYQVPAARPLSSGSAATPQRPQSARHHVPNASSRERSECQFSMSSTSRSAYGPKHESDAQRTPSDGRSRSGEHKREKLRDVGEALKEIRGPMGDIRRATPRRWILLQEWGDGSRPSGTGSGVREGWPMVIEDSHK
jgi:hypothetical protein